ncbi:protein of unknown function [Azospirillum baldaniorum]|uniref:Uncharacterized protein n=1 Tax=Azospirillum baldaniorum TaxID=1064539 RepID=A0A9P1NL39_9PROT|nr:protein of unknown function [Azospirillum baldaniorum]
MPTGTIPTKKLPLTQWASGELNREASRLGDAGSEDPTPEAGFRDETPDAAAQHPTPKI